ncbi:hypothetical protein B0H16DRAFT_1718891 [Mycena metata]|uniref:RlpA-like protein double-psi beta-barrel domain-containing protein n=1 Tax=Mycena metata TaxID=1033252 RepID=A0AAD7JF74_9AGAR|nr:hypothetical protein B0H16DRAFT_1718891 [Mycena metata]
MQFKFLALLSAFVTVAVAQELEDSGHLFIPDGALGSCGNPVLDTDLAVALGPAHWSDAFCGQTIQVAVQGSPSETVSVVVQDECLTCLKNQILLTPAAFTALIGNSPNKTIPVIYNLPE